MTPLNPDPLIPDGPEYDEPVPAGPGVMPWLWLVIAAVVVAVAVAWFALNGGNPR